MTKHLTIFILALVLIAGVPHARAEFKEHTHRSAALNKDTTFLAYAPQDAQPGERFPTLFVLHGAYGSYRDWVDKSPLPALAENYRMIIVCPDGGEFGWYVNSPVKKDSQYETYVSKELVAAVDEMFPTVAAREGRGIMGLSMGGHGALLLAAKHPGVFGSASSLSGDTELTDHPTRWHIVDALGNFDKNRKVWEANSVWEQAGRFKDANVRLLFDCGVDDTATSAIYDCRLAHELMAELGVPHIWRELPGTHSWKYWSENLEEHLNFHQAAMIDSTPGFGKWHRHYFERLRAFADENAKITVGRAMSPGGGAPSLCLLGSSSMEGFPVELISGFTVFNRGIISDVLGIGARGVSHRMELSVFDMRPDVIVIKNGLNDLGDRARSSDGKPTIDEMEAQMAGIVTRIKARQPNATIILTSETPVRGRYAHLTEGVKEYNRRLEALARREGIAFIDLFAPLADGEGQLKEELTSDGLHVKPPAYELWAGKIKEAVKR